MTTHGHSHSTTTRRGNTLVLVTAILVLLVILATAFLVRSQSARTQAVAENRVAGRSDRVKTITDGVAQEVADSLFVKPVDTSSLANQLTANTAAGVTGWQINIPRSDYSRLPADPLAIRYGVDYYDYINNSTLAGGSDNYLDGFNFAPFSVIPWTNWPDVYAQIAADGTVFGEGNPIGNPGFGDTRWLRSTEPVRALIMSQAPLPSIAVPPAPPNPQTSPVAPPNNWGNLALASVAGASTGVPVLSPQGLGFSHWSHLSWLPTAENGYRVCYDISDIELYTLAGFPGTPAGLNALGIPYEQWLTNVAPREVTLAAKDARGYLVLQRTASGGTLGGDWVTRRNNWFTNYTATLFGNPLEALPNYLQLSAFGDPSDEFKFEPSGALAGLPTSRALISRTLTDADGDGFTDSFWFVAPASADRDTRQIVGISITDNTGLLNVNIASRFERTNTSGVTPSDVALVSRGPSLDPTQYNGSPADGSNFADDPADDVAVGFLDARENDPEYFVHRADPPSAAGNPARFLIWARSFDGGGTPSAGVDVGFNHARWEGWRNYNGQPAVNGEANDMPGILESVGLMRAKASAANGTDKAPIPLFATDYGASFPTAGGNYYGGWFPLTSEFSRITYFKVMSNGGAMIDPVSSSPQAMLTPFGVDDEIELRAANGLNNAANISRLEMALGAGAPVVNGAGGQANINARDFLRGSRSREETVRHLVGLAGNQPNDPRNTDARARMAWGGQTTSMAASGAAELVLDHRHKLTTVNGARNEMMPPRLWSIIDPSAPNDLMRVRPAYIHRGVDFDHDGNPDDINGDGSVNGLDDLAPYHPMVVFYNTTPRGDGNGDGVVTLIDAELARQEFLRRNRKIDLRRPVDVPNALGVPATNAAILQAEREFRLDIQRVLRRALIDEDTRGSYFLAGSPATASAQDINEALVSTKLMAASMAANISTYRDSERRITNTIYRDGPVHPNDATAIPADAIQDPQYASGRFIGIEKQPFIQEVFIAFVYPKTKLDQSQLDAVTGPPGSPNVDCPDAAGCQLNSGDPYELPPCAEHGAGEHFVAYDPADPSTWPAVVFVAQVANPYNSPVNLEDFELRLNPSSGPAQRFFFALPDLAGGPTSRSGNTYGPDVELGPCTPEEPRTAIVFCIPETFPNGDAFPRDAWLDYLDIGAPIIETNPANDSKPGQFFVPDSNAIFQPAWGAAGPNGGFTAGTTLWDNNKRKGTLFFDATRTTTFPGLDITGNMARWQPAQSAGGPPPSSFIELRRAIYPATGGAPTWTVVDRLDNELDPGDQIFRDTLLRLYTPEHMPPLFDISCRMGKLAISGVRIRDNDYYTTWARGARQWLFDTQNNIAGTPLGKGVITLDERTPRYAFSRMTGVERVQESQTDAYNGGTPMSVKGSVFGEDDMPDGVAGGQPWFVMNYFDGAGVARRGKPTFFPTRIIEEAAGMDRLYAYPAWFLSGGNPPPGTVLSYGEKGATDAKYVDGTDPDNFMAPYRFYQKDADFTQTAEILDVSIWGPFVETGGQGRTFATLPEILIQQPDTTNTLKFPKAPAGANVAYWNRLQLDSARYDITPGPGGVPKLLTGIPVVPSPVGFISPQQAGLSLLDAFTVDDRGAELFDGNANGAIDFLERAAAEDRRLRLAQGYQGKATPGLINVNTAPVEVLRAMPLMDRLVYNDDREPHTRARLHVLNPSTGGSGEGLLNMTPNEKGVWFDYGAPAPRVRVAEAIDLWRNKGNVTPALGSTVVDPSIPSYYTRGLDLPDAQNNLEHAPGLRRERGIDSLGELALLTLGARYVDPTAPAAGDVGDSWNQAQSWSMRYAGLDPFRVSWSNPILGAGIFSQWAAGAASQIDGVPQAGNVLTVHEGVQDFPLSGRTSVDPHMLKVATDDRQTTAVVEPTLYRYDQTAGDALEQNQLLKAISNIATVRSDVFTVHLKIRTIRRNPMTGRWDATDPDYILDDSRYVMAVDRSQVDRPGEKPKVLYFTKVPN